MFITFFDSSLLFISLSSSYLVSLITFLWSLFKQSSHFSWWVLHFSFCAPLFFSTSALFVSSPSFFLTGSYVLFIRVVAVLPYSILILSTLSSPAILRSQLVFVQSKLMLLLLFMSGEYLRVLAPTKVVWSILSKNVTTLLTNCWHGSACL